MEIVPYEVKVFDNFIEITPTDGIKDNSTYEIRLKGLSEFQGKRTMEAKTITVTTALTPSYVTINSVQSLIEACEIPVNIILYHIREASRFVNYN